MARNREREQAMATLPAGVEAVRAAEEPQPEPAKRPGIYLVKWGSAPRMRVDSGLLESKDAEQIAWTRYREYFGIRRTDLRPDEMILTDAGPLTRDQAHGAAPRV